MHAVWVISVFAAMLAVAPSQAVECSAGAEGVREHVERADRLFRLSREYQKTPPERRDAFHIVYRLAVQEDVETLDACAVFQSGGSESIWAVDEAGRLTSPSADLIASDALVMVRSVGGEARVEAVFQPNAPLALRMDARALTRATAQATEVIKSAHGIVGLAAPGFTTVEFEWDGPAPSAEAVFANGRRTALDVIYDRAWFRPGRNAAERRAVWLEFGEPPARMVVAP